MASPGRWTTLSLVLLILADPRPAPAAGRVRLELFTDQHAPVTSQQEWLRRLSAVGVADLRIRTGGAADKVGIEVRGTEADPIYLVTGMITSGSELVLPGGRFRVSEAPQVARWLNHLAEKGIQQNQPPRSLFGLTTEQFDRALKDLAQPVGFSTRGTQRSEAVRKIGSRLECPLRIEAGSLPSDGEDKVAEELSGISSGTALACLLRPLGLGLVPRAGGRGELEYVVLRPTPPMEIWPVGWPPEGPLPQVLPAMYESFNANIQDVPVTTVLEALAKRLKTPFLLDHNALARHGIEPQNKKVNSPQSRTTSNQLLWKVLSQAGLTSEIRVDEAGKPLIWVTTVKPL